VVKRLEIDTRRGSGRPVVLISFVILALLVTTLWYREGDGGPVHVARRVMLAVSDPFATVGTLVTSPFRAISDWASGNSVNRAEFAVLKDQNTKLKAALAASEEQRLRLQRVAEMVQWVTAKNYPSVGASVIGRPSDSWGGSIMIDRGTNSGVKIGSPVVAAGGLVGQVIDATPWNARVRLITDANSGVAVIVQRTRANGIVLGSVDGKLHLDFVDKSSKPVRGDVLLTSGLGGVFPKDIVVGEVTDVSSEQADLFPDVTVASRVAVTQIEEVLVLTGVPAATLPGAGE
jgi:rod shape-determining protein MreC